MTQTAYDLAGGEEGIKRLAQAFYDKVFADPQLLPLFKDPDEDHAGRLALWLTELFGGPPLHSQRRGGFAQVVQAHEGGKFTQLQRDHWLEHMLSACKEQGLPEDLMVSFERYLDQSSRAAMLHSNMT